MEILIGIVIIFFVGRYFYKKENDSDGNNYNITPKTRVGPKTQAGYRPTNAASTANVTWRDQSSATGQIDLKDIEGLQDAFTGLSLDLQKGLYQCRSL